MTVAVRCPTLPRASATLIIATLTATGLAACGGSSAPVQNVAKISAPVVPNGNPAKPIFGTVSIRSGAAEPGSVQVQPGETISITNTDKAAHSLSDGKDKLTTGQIKPGATVTIAAPDRTGTYQLTDAHQLRLTVVVF